MNSRRVLITGASKGNGQVVAERLAASALRTVGLAQTAPARFPGEFHAVDLGDRAAGRLPRHGRRGIRWCLVLGLRLRPWREHQQWRAMTHAPTGDRLGNPEQQSNPPPAMPICSPPRATIRTDLPNWRTVNPVNIGTPSGCSALITCTTRFSPTSRSPPR